MVSGAAYHGAWQEVTIGDNKNTAYFHPLFIYNQSVIVRVADVTTESKKNGSINSGFEVS